MFSQTTYDEKMVLLGFSWIFYRIPKGVFRGTHGAHSEDTKADDEQAREMAEFDAKHPAISTKKEEEFQNQMQKVLDETTGALPVGSYGKSKKIMERNRSVHQKWSEG